MNNSLMDDSRKLLTAHNFMNAGRVFFDVFLNVFIWKQTESLFLIAMYNIVWGIFHTLSFTFFARFVKAGKMHYPRKFGLLGYAAAFLLIFALGERTVDFVYPIAVLLGISNAMYWISYQVLRFDLTSRTNRANYRGLEIAVKVVVETIVPVFAGAIIALDLFGLGYGPLYLIGAVFFIAAIVIGRVDHDPTDRGKLHVKKTIGILWKDRDIMRGMWSYFWSSFGRDGAISRLLVPLLVFSVLKDEFQLGGMLSFFALASAVFIFLIGKRIRFNQFNGSLTLGGALYTLLIMLLIFYPKFIVLVILGTSMRILTSMMNIPRRVVSENLIHNVPDFSYHRIEYIVIREWFNVGFGRIGSFAILLFATGLTIEALRYALVAIAVATVIEVYLIRKIRSDISE